MKEVAFVLFITAGASLLPASAFAGCFEDAANCFYAASRHDSFVWRTLAALDCELDLAECARKKVVGR
jgi:hypothetical protein